MKQFAAIAILLLGVAPVAFGGIDDAAAPTEAGNVGIFVSGGINMPQGDTAEGANNGLALGAGLSYNPTSRIALGGEVANNGVGIDDEALSGFGSDASVSMSVLRYSGFATVALTQRSLNTLFLKGTVGSYDSRLKLSAGGSDLTVSSSDIGFGGGLGYMINGRSGTAFIFETLYHHVPGDEGDMNFVTATIGMQFTIN